MTGVTVFSYQSGTTLFHRLDARVKLGALVVLSTASVHFGLPKLLLLLFSILWIMRSVHLMVSTVFRELRLFFILLAMIFLTRLFASPPIEVQASVSPYLSIPHVISAGIICLRLLIIVILGLVCIATTRSAQLKQAVEWSLTPFPFIPQRRVSTMIGLLLRFIPVIFDEAGQIRDAQRARGIEAIRNPVFRIVKLAVPLIRRTVLRADKLALAMEARLYQEMRTAPVLCFSREDILFTVAILLLLLMFLLW